MELISVLEKLKSESEFSSTNPVFIRINSDDSPCRVYLFFSKQEGSYLGIFHEKGKIVLQEKPLIQGLEIDEIEENNKIGTKSIHHTFHILRLLGRHLYCYYYFFVRVQW